MTITVNTTFQNTALPLDQSFKARLLAISSLQHWFQVAPDLVTLSGTEVSQVADKNQSAAYLAQATSSQRGIYTENQFGAYPGAVLDGSDDEYVLTGASIDTNAAFTWAAIFRATDNAANGQLMSNYVATNDGTYLGLNADGELSMRHGGGGGLLTADYVSDSLAVVVVGVSDGTLSMRVNGGATQTAATDNNGSTTSVRIGRLNSAGAQPLECAFSDLFFFNADLFSSLSQIELIEQYAARAYGVTLG